MPICACNCGTSAWSAIKRLLCIAYNNAYHILNYIIKNLSVHQHQVAYFLKTCDALIRKILYVFVQRCSTVLSACFK